MISGFKDFKGGKRRSFSEFSSLGRIQFSGSLSSSITSTSSFGIVQSSQFWDDGTQLAVPDYVYETDYSLKPLDQLNTFVQESKHLPGVPDMDDLDSWKDMSVGDRDMVLLEKIEEMSLYILQLHNRIKKLEEG